MLEKIEKLELSPQLEKKLKLFLTNNTNWTESQKSEFEEILILLLTEPIKR